MTEPDFDLIDNLADIIREVDRNHSLEPFALAREILSHRVIADIQFKEDNW